MQVTIQTTDAPSFDWGAEGAAEIVQNVLNLISTYKYEVAYDRTLGMRGDYVDQPLPIAVSLATAQIYSVIEEREPRALLKDVTFVGLSDEGAMNFKVVIEI